MPDEVSDGGRRVAVHEVVRVGVRAVVGRRRLPAVDVDKLVCPLDRKGAEQDRVDDAEDGAVHADA